LRLQREFGDVNTGTRLVYWIFDEQPEEVKLAALDVLALSDNREVMESLVAAYGKFPAKLKSKVRDVLSSRPPSAIALLQTIDAGGIPADDVSIGELRRLALYSNDVIDAIVRKHWGNIGPGSPEEKLATMRRFNNDLRSEAGDPQQGKGLFAKHCGVCHQLYGEGKKIGPDLTTANRQDRAALLSNIVDPSAVIRREFVSYVVVTSTGQVYAGLLAEQDAATITVLDANNQRIKLQRDEIESIEESDVSLMPERILDALTPQQLRDLFAYLQQAAP
jgi:putative heme-binding domain-containing protein